MIHRWLKVLWAFPNTCLGLLFLLLGLLTGQRPALINGVAEISGGPIGFFLKHCVPLRGGASAMTLGHVVLGRDQDSLERTRRHERVHVKQAETWGPFFLPAYAAAGVWALCRGGNVYRDNHFERKARRGEKTVGPGTGENRRSAFSNQQSGEKWDPGPGTREENITQ